MATRNTCVLTFNTSLEKRKSISINEPRSGLDASNVNMAASMLANADAFDSTVGSLTGLAKADLVSVTTTTVI
jgi:hypothetical protein